MADSWITEALEKIFAQTTGLQKSQIHGPLRENLEKLVQWAYDDGWDAGAQAALRDPNEPRMHWVRQTVEHRRLSKLFSNMETEPLTDADAFAIMKVVINTPWKEK